MTIVSRRLSSCCFSPSAIQGAEQPPAPCSRTHTGRVESSRTNGFQPTCRPPSRPRLSEAPLNCRGARKEGTHHMNAGPVILIVEDDKAIIRVLTNSLEAEGDHVLDASTG